MKKKFSNLWNKAILVGAGLVASVSSFAQADQYSTAKDLINGFSTELNDVGKPVANVALILLALIGLVLIIWGYLRHGKGDSGANDALAKVGVGFLIAAGFVLIIRVMFFR